MNMPWARAWRAGAVSSPAQAPPKPGVAAFWSLPLEELLAAVAAGAAGLPPDEAARRLARDGPNTIEVAHAHRGPRLLLAQFASPIVLILVAATMLSMALGDLVDGSIILVIVAASGALGFWQEHGAGRAVDALLAQVRVLVEVRRGRRRLSVPSRRWWSATSWYSTPAMWCRPTAGSPARRSCWWTRRR
jgi:hypothetical protein